MTIRIGFLRSPGLSYQRLLGGRYFALVFFYLAWWRERSRA